MIIGLNFGFFLLTTNNTCSGSGFGSVCSGLQDPDPEPYINKQKYNRKKNLDFYSSGINFYKNLFFVGILKATEEKSRIQQDPDSDP